MKACELCGTLFKPYRSTSKYCKVTCQQTANYRKNPLAHRASDIKRKYGVTVEQVEAQADEQGHVCAICGEACRTRLTLTIDHDHDTGKVRGLLCNDCNRAIGLLGDNAERIAAAAEYVANGGVWNV